MLYLKNILVIFGGVSQEHDISVITGVLTLNTIDACKYLTIPIYIDKNGAWFTGEELNDVSVYKNLDVKKLKRAILISGDNTLYIVDKKLKPVCQIDAAINCLHGRNGEDGSIAGVINLSKIALASPNIFSSSMSMDKDITKKCLQGLGVNTVRSVTVERDSYYKDKNGAFSQIERLGFPVIIKPCSSGSSIGITVCRERSELFAAMELAFRFDVKLIAEVFMQGFYDVNCACYCSGGEFIVSECERPHGGEFLSFADKYQGAKTGSTSEFPANIDKAVSEKIKQTTKLVYKTFGFSGIVRIDYLVCNNEVYLNEINSIPGSLAYYLFCKSTKEFSKLLSSLIEESLLRAKAYYNCQFTYASNVLQLDGVKLKK